jgi:hypothetical protein
MIGVPQLPATQPINAKTIDFTTNNAEANAPCASGSGRIVKIDDATNNLAIVDISGIGRQLNIACIVD